MKNRLIQTLLIILGVTLSCIPVYAADVRIVLDGSEINYSQIIDDTGIITLPQIIKDRAMVPVRQTTVLLGINLDWNSETRVMTFTKDGLVSTHLLGSKDVTIGGVTKTYDKESEVVEGKTLMPNIMIADIINCDTWWEQSTYTVMMQTRQQKPAVVAAVKPTVISALSNKRQVAVGEEVSITVIASDITTAVNLVDASGKVLATSTQFAQSGTGRTFDMRYTPKTATFGTLTYKVQAGDQTGFNNGSSQTVQLSVISGISVVNAYTDDDKPYLGDKAKLTVVASSGVAKARVTDKNTNKAYEPTNSTTDTSGNKVFTFEVTTEREGSVVFAIEITAGATYVTDAKTITLSVQSERPKDTLAISDITYDTTKTYNKGDIVTVSVKTSRSTEKLDYKDEQSNEWSRKYSTYIDSSTYRTYEITVALNNVGVNSFNVFAYNSENKSVEKRFQITAGQTSTNTIQSVKRLTKVGTSWEFEIITTNTVNRLDVRDVATGTDSGIYVSPSTATGTNLLRWVVTANDTLTVFNIRATNNDNTVSEVPYYIPSVMDEWKP